MGHRCMGWATLAPLLSRLWTRFSGAFWWAKHSNTPLSSFGLILDKNIIYLYQVLLCSALALYISCGVFSQWQERKVMTVLADTDHPVTELHFPAVTICSQGLNMMVSPLHIFLLFIILRRWRGLCRRTWTSGLVRDGGRGRVNTSQVLSADSWRKSSIWGRTKVSLTCWKPLLFLLLMLLGQWWPMQSGKYRRKNSCTFSGIILPSAMTRY